MEKKRLYRSRKNRVLCGVCGGLGEYFHIDPVLVRLIWVAVLLFLPGRRLFWMLPMAFFPGRHLLQFFWGIPALGTVVLLYFVAAVIIPKAEEE